MQQTVAAASPSPKPKSKTKASTKTPGATKGLKISAVKEPVPDDSNSLAIVTPSCVTRLCRELGMVEVHHDVANCLAQDVEYRLREVLEEAMKVQTLSKSPCLTVDHVNTVLKLKTGETLVGFSSHVQRQEATSAEGGAPAVVFVKDGTEDISDAANKPLPKIPLEPNLVLHWLAIDGQQPNTPYNPRREDVGSADSRPQCMDDPTLAMSALQDKLFGMLSQELNVYARKVVSGICYGTPQEREVMVSSLSSDPGLHALVPFLSICTYQLSLDAMNAKDLRLFWAAAWFYRAMVCNPYMHLTLYLQRILPGLATLVANSKVTEGDHWAPRVFSAMTTAMVVERYAVIYPPLRGQVAKTFEQQLKAFLAEQQWLADEENKREGDVANRGSKKGKKRPAPTSSTKKGGKGEESKEKVNMVMVYGCITGLRYLGGRSVEMNLLRVAAALLHSVNAVAHDLKEKPKKRQEALRCVEALEAALGEYWDRHIRGKKQPSWLPTQRQTKEVPSNARVQVLMCSEHMMPYTALDQLTPAAYLTL